MFREAMRLMLGPKLLRLKGLIAMVDDPERPMLIHAVQSVADALSASRAWPSRDRRTRLVIIAQGEVRQTIEGFWKA